MLKWKTTADTATKIEITKGEIWFFFLTALSVLDMLERFFAVLRCFIGSKKNDESHLRLNSKHKMKNRAIFQSHKCIIMAINSSRVEAEGVNRTKHLLAVGRRHTNHDWSDRILSTLRSNPFIEILKFVTFELPEKLVETKQWNDNQTDE